MGVIIKNIFRKPHWLLCILVLLILLNLDTNAQHTTARSYQVKAAFLYNFSQFVEWPLDAFSGPGDPFVIGLLGPNPFGSYLNELVAGEKINGHPILVKHLKDTNEVKSCHILYINTPDPKDVIKALNKRSILTVSDAPDFASKGGMIHFFIENNKIRLQINPESAKAARLVISSKLLRLAQIVE